MLPVARQAGVSHQAVSRVVTEQTGVRPETRRRVLDAIRELDHQPDSGAGSADDEIRLAGRLPVRANSGPPHRPVADPASAQPLTAHLHDVGRDQESNRPL
jgi:hypothetical protein